MAKYDALHRYLRRQITPELELSFHEIENLLVALLPKRAAHPQWWAGEPGPASHPAQTPAWLDAGYGASLIVGCDRVRFHRLEQPSA